MFPRRDNILSWVEGERGAGKKKSVMDVWAVRRSQKKPVKLQCTVLGGEELILSSFSFCSECVDDSSNFWSASEDSQPETLCQSLEIHSGNAVLPVASQTTSGVSANLPQIPCKNPGRLVRVRGLIIEIHFLPSSVDSSSKVLVRGMVSVVHEDAMYLRCGGVEDSDIFGGQGFWKFTGVSVEESWSI